MTFRILSLDGGGIRGVLSATILETVESILWQKKQQKLHEYFDLIAGTSTGSILAAGIACEMEAAELTKIYQKRGKDIFLEGVSQQRQWRWLLGRLASRFALYPHVQGDQGLAKVLEEELIYQGKSPNIGEIRSPHLLILAYDVLSRNTTWFTNNSPDQERWYDRLPLWEICTSSASAPTFFPPYELRYTDGKSLPHIDGGVSANNPSLSAIAHALLIKKAEKLDLQDIVVLSIGTGKTTHPYTYQEIKGWGLVKWISNLPDIFLNPGAKNTEDICQQLIESVGSTHLRLDFDLNEQFAGEKQPGKLRTLLAEPYNEYIFKKSGERKKISEEIDNPHICDDLIEAAKCYLKYGKISYKGEDMPIESAIQGFITSNEQ